MKNIFAFIIIILSTQLALAAKVKCTTEDKSKWIDQKKFQADLVTEGYKIKVFKIANGSCYEIYGWDKAGKKVEIYFNPVTAAIVKKEMR